MKATKTNRKLNVKLLRRIRKHILAEPRRFVMSKPIIRADCQENWNRVATSDASESMPRCGTAACIAGWAILLTDGAGPLPFDAISRAAGLLGVPPTDEWVDHDLFYAPSWPAPYRARYERAVTPKQRAKIAAARIEHLIATGE